MWLPLHPVTLTGVHEQGVRQLALMCSLGMDILPQTSSYKYGGHCPKFIRTFKNCFAIGELPHRIPSQQTGHHLRQRLKTELLPELLRIYRNCFESLATQTERSAVAGAGLMTETEGMCWLLLILSLTIYWSWSTTNSRNIIASRDSLQWQYYCYLEPILSDYFY